LRDQLIAVTGHHPPKLDGIWKIESARKKLGPRVTQAELSGEGV